MTTNEHAKPLWGGVASVSRVLAFLLVWALVGFATGCGSSQGSEPDNPSAPSADADKPLTDAEIYSFPPPTYEGFLSAYREVAKAHPGINPATHRFVRLVWERIRSMQAQSGAPVKHGVAATNRFLSMTLPQWKLALNPLNMAKAVETTFLANEATARAQKDFAYTELEQDGGRGDAFRHAYWSALMAQCCGEQWARDFGVAHEFGSAGSESTNMDLNNNDVGRKIQASNPKASPDEYAALIKAYPAACYTRALDSARVTIDPSRLVYFGSCPGFRITDDVGPAFHQFEVHFDGVLRGRTQMQFGGTYAPNAAVSGKHMVKVTCSYISSFDDVCGFGVEPAGTTFEDASSAKKVFSVKINESKEIPLIFPVFGQ